jgi:hypothetical protein
MLLPLPDIGICSTTGITLFWGIEGEERIRALESEKVLFPLNPLLKLSDCITVGFNAFCDVEVEAILRG